jgi:hypothetical protein
MLQEKFTLVNYGGSFQLEIRSAADLDALRIMDDVFWMATSVPIYGLNCDPDLVSILDKDGNGRVLSSELRENILFLLDSLNEHTAIDQRESYLLYSRFNEKNELGLKLKIATKEILENLDCPLNKPLTLEDLRNTKAIYKYGVSNGDGIIPVSEVEDSELRAFIEDIILCLGSADDVNGQPGVGKYRLDKFLNCAQDYLTWKESREFDPEILPLQEKTAAAYKVFNDLRPKIDEYFRLCNISKFNKSINRIQKEPVSPEEIYADVSLQSQYLLQAPIAALNSTLELRFSGALNPVYENKLFQLRETVLDAFLARPVQALTENDWRKVCDIFKPYSLWYGSRKGAEVKALDDHKLKAYLKGDLPAKLQSLIDEDLQLGAKLKLISRLEELIILQKNIIDFSNNFISFPHLYDPSKRAVFEAGHFVIDGRIFNFNIPIECVESHSKIAAKSGIYLLYSEITGGIEDKPWYVCTPVTSSSLGLLGIGKRGVLFDLKGKEWDARVVKVINNPVSLSEAVLAPFRKIIQILIDAVDKISAGSEKEIASQLTSAGANLQKNMMTISTDAKEPTSSTTARDLMVTGSVTFAALGSSFAYISSTFMSMNWEDRAATFGIGVLALILPVLIVASIRLYSRNISSILEASGWAINARMRLTVKLAAILAPSPESPGRVFKRKRDILKSFTNKFSFRLDNKER